MLNLIDAALRTPLARMMAWPHSPESYLEFLAPKVGGQAIKATIKDVQQQTPRAVSLVLQPNHRWTGYQPGQYVTLTVSINGRRHSRCFTVSHTEAGCPVVTIQAHANGIVSAWANDTVWKGDEVEISAAQGNFVLPSERPDAFLFIAGGSGITPIRALVDALVAEDYTGVVDILYYVPQTIDAIFREHFELLASLSPNIRLHLIPTRATDGYEGLQGHFSAEHLTHLRANPESAASYVCGPAALMDAVQAHWQSRQCESRLTRENFQAVARAVSPSQEAQPVYFSESQVSSSAADKTLLEVAEGAGLSPSYGCRQGICRTCTCRKTSGQVRDIRTGEISDNGEEDIAICVSVPVTPVTLSL